ncbi:MAG: putative secreted protein, partial [Capsulimonas sp.]|nr:putative secreted protein [Capsulimonas sp.]
GANGAPVIQYSWEANPWFKWRFESVGGADLKVTSLMALTRVLSVVGGSTAAAANTQILDYDSANTGYQKVRIVPKTNGLNKFYFVHDGMSWDIPGGATGDNIPLQQYPDNGNAQQQFRLDRVP